MIKIFGVEYFFWNRGKGDKYLEKEISFFVDERKKQRKKRWKIFGEFAFLQICLGLKCSSINTAVSLL